MNRALVLLFLSGCTPTFLQSGRYACEPGEADQCPGAWRCGLEGYCHQLGNTSVAWRCETSADCEGGFACGIARSAEFRECHDPAAPKDWPCEVAGDCLGGWSCGLAFNRVEGECHDPANPRAWACDDDTDCLSGWRCGTELTCVDPKRDELGTTPPPMVDGGAHLNSLTSKSPIGLFSVSPFYAQEPGIGRGNLAFVQDGHVRARSFNLATGQFADFDLGTERLTSLLALGSRGTDAFGDPDQLDRVAATLPDGGLVTWVFSDGGFEEFRQVVDPVPPVLNVEKLAHGSAAGSFAPSVLAFESTPHAGFGRLRGGRFYEESLGTISDFRLFRNVQNNRIHGMTSLRHDDTVECVYLVDDRGLWASQINEPYSSNNSFPFEPVRIDGFSHAECGGSAQPRIDSVVSVYDRWLAVTAIADGGVVQVAVLDALRTWNTRAPGTSVTPWFCTSSGSGSCDPISRIQVDLGYGPCVACPTGSTLEHMSTVLNGPNAAPDLEVLCGQTGIDAGMSGLGSVFHLARTAGSTGCTRTLVTGESSFFAEPDPSPGASAPGGVAWSGSGGQLWFASRSSEIASFTFDRPATGVVRRGPGADELIAFTPQLLGTPASGLGLFSTRSSVLSAPVSGAPSLAVAGAQLIDLSGTSAISEARPLGFLPSGLQGGVSVSTAVLTRSSQGARLVVISSGSSLYVGDLEAVLSSSGPPVALSLRLNTGEPVSSLAFPRVQATDGPIAAGYAVAGSNVVHIVADTLSRWRTEAVDTPPFLSPRQTWFDGTRGRVGFHDGSVFSLPSRVRISPPLPGDEAVDYAQACGQQLALAPLGLYRLMTNPLGGAVGQWVRIPLATQIDGLNFTEGRVHAVGNEVFVFTRSGEAARITFASCPE